MQHDIFISFSSKNADLAKDIARRLFEDYGITYWICTNDIVAGGRYQSAITEAIDACSAVLFLQSRDSMASKEVEKEISMSSNRNKMIIPFRLDTAPLIGSFAYELSSVQYIDGTLTPFEDRIEELAELIYDIIGERKPAVIVDGEDNVMVNSETVVIKTHQNPGIVVFNNYERLKRQLEYSLKRYSEAEYTLDTIDRAREDHKELKAFKGVFEDKKKEIEAIYSAPYIEVEKRLNELIDMIKVPLKNADDFIKKSEKDAKRKEILDYAMQNSYLLGAYAQKIINSPAFFNEKWLNVSCRAKQWKVEVEGVINKAYGDIMYLQANEGASSPVLMAQYCETLSIERARQFADSVQLSAQERPQEQERSIVVKITGESSVVDRALVQLAHMGLAVEEIK